MTENNKGVLIVNLGSPKSTSVADVRTYLREFLMDKRVIDLPYLLRKILVEVFVLPTRPKKSAKAYRSIWLDKGSPLVVITQRQLNGLKESIEMPAAMGMRYGSPSIAEGLEVLYRKGVRQVLVIPLYPQYAMSTTETVVDKAQEVQKKDFPELKLSFLPPFYNNPDYINALASVTKRYLPSDFDLLVLSYHGVPIRHIKKTGGSKNHSKEGVCLSDPCVSADVCYRYQCHETSRLLAKALGLPKEKYKTTFQSRFGKDPWIQPFTDKTLEQLPKEGIKNIAIATPAFVTDCLETLEEIAEENKEVFKESGGEDYRFIPCLNDDPVWIDVLKKWIKQSF